MKHLPAFSLEGIISLPEAFHEPLGSQNESLSSAFGFGFTSMPSLALSSSVPSDLGSGVHWILSLPLQRPNFQSSPEGWGKVVVGCAEERGLGVEDEEGGSNHISNGISTITLFTGPFSLSSKYLFLPVSELPLLWGSGVQIWLLPDFSTTSLKFSFFRTVKPATAKSSL